MYTHNSQGTGENTKYLQQQCWYALRIFASANLSLREWVINNTELRELLHLKVLASESEDKVKVLSIDWLNNDDMLQMKGRRCDPDSVTKRVVLSTSITASVFHPAT